MSNRDKVIEWIKSGMDYNQGVSLLLEITHKQSFQNQFSGSPKYLASKLAYEICKASAVANVRTWKDFIAQHKIQSCENPATHVNLDDFQIPSGQTSEQAAQQFTEPALLEDSTKEYPPIIRRIVHEYASSFQERSRLHSTLTEMPQSNADSVCKARKEQLDCIKSLSARLELLYQAKQAYETEGTLPDPELLFPSQPTQQEEDYNCLDQEELKKRKKNLQNGNSKDQSILDYQSKEHGTAKSPMPQGPKRLKIEYRIRQRQQQILQIDKAQLKYVIKE